MSQVSPSHGNRSASALKSLTPAPPRFPVNSHAFSTPDPTRSANADAFFFHFLKRSFKSIPLRPQLSRLLNTGSSSIRRQQSPPNQSAARPQSIRPQIRDELEKHEEYFVNLATQLLASFKKELEPSINHIGKVVENLKNLSQGKDEVVISPSNNGDGLLCFYDVLADYFVRMPESTKPILDLIVQLWSQSFASHIFALLFHKWLFEVQLDNPEVLLRYSSALVQGATNVFWIDIQSNTRRFQSLFHYLLEDVALDNSRLNKIPVQAQRDMYLLLSRFILFYNSADKMESFLKQCPDFPNAIFVGGPADIFVTELTDQLQKLKVEPVLLHYLKEIKILQGMELRLATVTRLKTCLYSFTSPGGPLYPTRTVRHAAWEALDLLFPVGQYLRHLISLFFRLLYPWYWPSSCWNFVVSCVKAVFMYLWMFILSLWEKFAKPKAS